MNFRSVLVNIVNRIDKIEEKLLVVICSVMIIVGVMQVSSRFVFKIPLPWSEELLRFCFVWLTFFAASLGMSRETHVNLSFVVNKLTLKGNKIARALIRIISLVFVVVVFILMFITTISAFSTGERSAAMELPIVIPYSGVVVAFFFMILQILKKLVDIFYVNTNS